MTQHVSAETCPFARTVDTVKERWTFLVMREALTAQATTFDDFLEIPDMTREVLAERLDLLVSIGVFVERRDDASGDGTAIAGYDLTDAGMQLVIILRALGDWADRFAPDES
ncbi:winged helix-turn-helix transcriptional regulator [Herbiconiux sp. P17]|uniref:winged helix-turn-helix transcriptional regulator n=1 Tax=Herbiconiux wuyangfengii TaxID=3342794 RepID=UPI0035BAF26E